MRDYELVVVAYRSRGQIEQMLSGLPDDIPLAVVDNAGGSDGLPELVAARRNARYLDGGGRGFARASNLGALTSPYDVVVFLNPDASPTADVLDSLVADVRADENCAGSAALPVEPDGTTEAGGWEPTVARALVHALGVHRLAPRSGLIARPKPGEDMDVDWINAACMAVRRDTFAALGGWDEKYYVYCEDVAFGRTVREQGMHQRLRTDLLVPHGRASSGAPSLEMSRLNGAMMAHYLRDHDRRPAAQMIIGALTVGFLARAVVQRLVGGPETAREHISFVRGLLTGRAFVGGTEISVPRSTDRQSTVTPLPSTVDMREAHAQ